MTVLNRSFMLFLCAFVFSAAAHAQTYDLAADWSDVNNPNGVWALYKAPGQLFTINQADWYGNETNQPAWADATGPDPFPPNPLAPMWAKAIGDVGTLSQNIYDGFVDAGTVIMHSAEAFRTGTDFSSVVWTSPQDGLIRFDTDLWIAKAFDRPHTWELRKNGAVHIAGSLTQADPYTKTNPLHLSGAIPVAANDQIELLMYRPLGTLVPGTLIAVNHRIQYIPEPSGWVLAALAVAGRALVRSRRRS